MGGGAVYSGLWGGLVRRCVFEGSVANAQVTAYGRFEQCRFKTCRLLQGSSWIDLQAIACVFDGANFQTYGGVYSSHTHTALQCVFYNAGVISAVEKLILRNNIFFRDDGGLALELGYPVEIDSDSNCFYCDKADPLRLNGVDYTFAQWQALGYDEHSKNADPLLENPAGGDFTPKKASPATALCPSCGVKYDYNGKKFRLTRCNAGAIETDWTRTFG